jgi:thioredoxin reductase
VGDDGAAHAEYVNDVVEASMAAAAGGDDAASLRGDCAARVGRLSGLTLTTTRTGQRSRLDVSGLFVAIGHDPRSELFRAATWWSRGIARPSARPARAS